MPCYSDCPDSESKHLTVTNYVQFTAYEKNHMVKCIAI